MTRKFKILLYILVFGLCLNTFFGYAIILIPQKTAKTICCKKQPIKIEKSCCQKEKNQKEQKNCEGKCKSTCTVVQFQFSSIVMPAFSFDLKYFDFYYKKTSFYCNKTFVNKGFISIWLLPKIA